MAAILDAELLHRLAILVVRLGQDFALRHDLRVTAHACEVSTRCIALVGYVVDAKDGHALLDHNFHR